MPIVATIRATVVAVVATVALVLIFTAPSGAFEVVVPESVPFQYGVGKAAYEQHCAQCHGAWGGGSNEGPPLMHAYYVASHHGDLSFRRAISQGTRQHHWNFGDMKPVPGLSERQVNRVIEYVRWLQSLNGLH